MLCLEIVPLGITLVWPPASVSPSRQWEDSQALLLRGGASGRAGEEFPGFSQFLNDSCFGHITYLTELQGLLLSLLPPQKHLPRYAAILTGDSTPQSFIGCVCGRYHGSRMPRSIRHMSSHRLTLKSGGVYLLHRELSVIWLLKAACAFKEQTDCIELGASKNRGKANVVDSSQGNVLKLIKHSTEEHNENQI